MNFVLQCMRARIVHVSDVWADDNSEVWIATAPCTLTNEWTDVRTSDTSCERRDTRRVERTASACQCLQRRESIGYERDHTAVLVGKNVDVSVIVACLTSAENVCRSFADKVAKIHAATTDTDASTFSRVRTGISLQSFTPFAVNYVADAICHLPECSAADPIPTYMLKWISDQIAPFIMSLFNRSLASGRFPVSFLHTLIGL